MRAFFFYLEVKRGDSVEVVDESRRRADYARNVLKDGRVMEVLEEYGRALVVGSLALDVFWKRDIDIVVETKKVREASIRVLNKFIEGRRFSKYQYGDFVEYPREGRPRGYIVNLLHRGEDGEVWEIEIWFLEDTSSYEEQLKKWRGALDEEKRRRIINLKARDINRKSMEIYEEVLKIEE